MGDLLEELLEARRSGRPCALATVAATAGSVPRNIGAKMIIYADGTLSGTIGGGKFESLVIAEAAGCIERNEPLLKTWHLRESLPDSFGAICGGEVTVLIEPQTPPWRMFVIGGGHCGQAITRLAAGCGFHVTVLDDREDILAQCHAAHNRLTDPAPGFIGSRVWTKNDAIVIATRRYDMDCEALAAALANGGAGYIGMIGSRRKVRKIFDLLKADGFTEAQLATAHAPMGLDIGADSPAEIAVSLIAEVLMVLRGKSGRPMKLP